MLAKDCGATPGNISSIVVLTHRVSTGYSDVEGLMMYTKSLLRDVVKRSRVVRKRTDLQMSTGVSAAAVYRDNHIMARS